MLSANKIGNMIEISTISMSCRQNLFIPLPSEDNYSVNIIDIWEIREGQRVEFEFSKEMVFRAESARRERFIIFHNMATP